jgi:hypothetical protein
MGEDPNPAFSKGLSPPDRHGPGLSLSMMHCNICNSPGLSQVGFFATIRPASNLTARDSTQQRNSGSEWRPAADRHRGGDRRTKNMEN